MPTIDTSDTCRTPNGLAWAAAAGAYEAAGAYLTDGVFLYRVAGVVRGASGEMIELEDCFFLDVVEVPLADVRARRLRVVVPSGDHG